MNYSAKQLAHAFRKLSCDMTTTEQTKLAQQIVQFCESKNLTHLLPQIVKHMEYWEKNIHSQQKITVITPYKLKQVQLKQIVSHLKLPKDKQIENEIDENMLGGYKVIYANNVYDSTIRNNMQRLKDNLTLV